MLIKEFRKKLALNSKLSLTPQEIEDELQHQFWKYKKSPCYLTLTVIIFRRDPQLTPNVIEVLGDASNNPLSQAARKREDQNLQQVTNALSICFWWRCIWLKIFRNANRFFRIPKTPSMSLQTDSSIADHFIVWLPSSPVFLRIYKTWLAKISTIANKVWPMKWLIVPCSA